MFDLSTLSLSQSAAVYNACSAKPVKKFSSKDEAARRVSAALESSGRVLVSFPDEGPVFANASADIASGVLPVAEAGDPDVETFVQIDPLDPVSDEEFAGEYDSLLANVDVVLYSVVAVTDGVRTIVDSAPALESARDKFDGYVAFVIINEDDARCDAVELFDGTPGASRTLLVWTEADGVVEVEPEEAEVPFVKATKAELDAMDGPTRQAYRKARRKAARDRRKAS